jgi:hypothetical protein
MSNPLSPLAMLATSMQAQPGVYALLQGSGVSTDAGVPTGWASSPSWCDRWLRLPTHWPW